MNEKIVIFSDGSSRGNPGPGGWGAIVAVDGKVTELSGREDHTTNNRMELLGAINALSSLGHPMSKLEEIVLNTDSSYVINGITKWVYGWQKNGWKKKRSRHFGRDSNQSVGEENVVNRDLWEELIKVSKGRKIKWNYVGGHVGIPGNERCDEIATSFADNVNINLFKGKISDYKIDLFATKGNEAKKAHKSKNNKPAYSYLSLVHGVLKIDKTWADCEKRVKGVKGDVKFRKATSEDDEKRIIKEWSLL